MQISRKLAVLALLSTAVVNAREADDRVDVESYWNPGTEDQSLTDQFGNKIYFSDEGSFVYTDESNITWYFYPEGVDQYSQDTWRGSDPEGDQWFYEADGTMFYQDVLGNQWLRMPGDYEAFMQIGTYDLTFTFPYDGQGVEQFHYECKLEGGCLDAFNPCWSNLQVQWAAGTITLDDLESLTCADFDFYHYFSNGDRQFSNADYSIAWTWFEADHKWELYDGEVDVTFGSYSDIGYVEEPYLDGENMEEHTYSLTFDQALEEWVFSDPLDSRVYYYEEFAWGNADQTWFLRNDYHDIYTQVGGFWPLSPQ